MVSSRAEAAGTKLLKRLNGLLDLPAVGEVREPSLLTAVEIVADRERRESYPGGEKMAERDPARSHAPGRHESSASGGQDRGQGDLLLLGPPFTISDAEIEEAVGTLGDAISAVTRT